MNTPLLRTVWPSLAALAWLTLSSTAHADGDRRIMPATIPKAYTQECAACHTAYPPGFLPAASWQRIMSGLDKHYGSDAALDEATTRDLSRWLTQNAGTYKRVNEAPPDDRITQSQWFVRKHRKIDDQVWKHVSVKSAANCAACHTGTEKGRYDDDNLRIPPGLPARLTRGWED